ncbi:DUF6246 family protein [Dickeya fangzhongdai]|uniref:DUF6246 family protein n=1 Tax=Dickeya fangzhongdai TaxID=1778540 RepID=UPI0004F8620F|nr:DUF6246 family protein [Dickeya fangzhongdai]AIR71480.1 hypothetical protein LH89_20545 [Dickeya fangzhongdai]KGT98508.1 hypothetical protein NM75_09280 [Dickeya fangzhongdai]
MTPFKAIGECVISMLDQDYLFRPSFAAMTRVGEPAQIVRAFYDLHNDEARQLIERAAAAYGVVPAWLVTHVSRPAFSKQAALQAVTVLQACCDMDCSALTGELVPRKTGKGGVIWRPGSMPVSDVVLVAQSLLTHGIIGKARVRRLQRHESTERTTEFHAIEYINAARSHFSMSRHEAENLTMTEFVMLLAAKYPDQKGFTREEYDQLADDYMRRKAARIEKEK